MVNLMNTSLGMYSPGSLSCPFLWDLFGMVIQISSHSVYNSVTEHMGGQGSSNFCKFYSKDFFCRNLWQDLKDGWQDLKNNFLP